MLLQKHFLRLSFLVLNFFLTSQIEAEKLGSCKTELNEETTKVLVAVDTPVHSYEIKELWKKEETRLMLEFYFRERLFKFDPYFANDFVDKVDYLLSKNLSEEAFHLNLKNFVEPYRARILADWEP